MTTLDDQVVELRSRGHSYARIARDLGFDRPVEASDAFNRAVRARPDGERASLRHQENRRFDELAEQIRQRPDLSDDELDRRLRAIEALRRRMLSD